MPSLDDTGAPAIGAPASGVPSAALGARVPPLAPAPAPAAAGVDRATPVGAGTSASGRTGSVAGSSAGSSPGAHAHRFAAPGHGAVGGAWAPQRPWPAALAGGVQGARLLRPLLDTVLEALAEGAIHRAGPLPAGGPATVARRVDTAATPVLPESGRGAEAALRSLVRTLAEGAADPADPYCAAHLHCPPLAVAVAAELAVCALNPSLDSWDQAPAASALEGQVTADLARLVFPDLPDPDVLVTTGATESNHLALLLARERARAAGSPRLQALCGANAHHSIHRAAWLLGLPEPLVLPTPRGILDPAAVDLALAQTRGPALVIATAGTTDTGTIDPLPELARAVATHGTELHVDAAYGGPLLFSTRRRHLLTGLQSATSVSFDLHKLGWQPVAAGLLAVSSATALRPLDHHADYLNAADDTDAGLPDLLGRSLRTTRRPDILKIAVTLRALGRQGLAALVDRVCDQAQHLAELIDAHPGLVLHSRPAISTVLFRPFGATDAQVAAIRRSLMTRGTAVLGRARVPGPDATPALWLKATLLNPTVRPHHLTSLLRLVTEAAEATQAVATAEADQAAEAPAQEGTSTR